MLRAYYIIRQDLGMSAGKMAVQVGHGTGKIYTYRYNIPGLEDWMANCDATKIVLRVKTLKKLYNLMKILEDNEIPFSDIRDKGYTEFDGRLTLTGIVIFPIDKNKLPEQIQKLQTWK